MRKFLTVNASIFQRLDRVETKLLDSDRFLIIDEKIIYHIGASLKDLGKKWFAFSEMKRNPLECLEKLP